jgi:phosphatidylglycerophosphatase A
VYVVVIARAAHTLVEHVTWRGVASLGGLGRLPIAPATWASIAGVVAGSIVRRLGRAHFWVIAAVAVPAAMAVTAHASRAAEETDPSWIVVDDAVGAFVSMAPGGRARGLRGALARFLAFRAFDIVKPGVIGRVDREIRSPVGIVLDDVLAGLAVVFLFARRR